jgi:hypothetical protein
MMTKNFLRLFAAMLMTLGVLSAQAQPAVHPKAYYDAITYQWTDASGATHENAITDVATNPYQIVALLKKVYCDPNIPGPHYSAYETDGTRSREVDYGAVGGGWNISADDVIKPYEDGYTLLMVSVKENLTLRTNDDYGSYEFPNAEALVTYIGNNIDAVQLLTDGLRIGEGMRAGTTFNISGEFNRFFILGKGQARQKTEWVTRQQTNNNRIYGERVPFKSMFEEFSPTDGSANSQITDFYAKMVAGASYPVVHDCASVLQTEHYFSMAGKNNHESRSLTGLNIFIPDYRLLYWETYDNNNHHVAGRMMNPYYDLNGRVIRTSRSYFEVDYAQYNPDYAPEVGIYTIKLNGKAEPAAEERTYDVTLDWTSSLDDMAHGTVGQDYILYLVLTDEYGNETREEIIKTTETTYTYPVPQDEHSYTLSYIVFGQPNDGEHDMFVAWSNQVDIVIPGWNDFLTLKLNHYESDYKIEAEKNYYRNFLNVMNDDAVNGLTTARVNAGENNFTLYRYDVAAPDAMVPVATMTITAGNNTRYSITYQNQEPLASYNVNVTTSGNLSVGAGGVIDMSNILFVDQFAASTALNDHPVRYGYVLMLTNGDKGTNTVEVPVFKTNAKLGGYYTEEEVLADEHELLAGVKNGSVDVNLQPNPSIYYYTVGRGDNALPVTEFSKMQLRTDGTFMEMSDALGMEGMIINAGPNNFKDPLIITGDAGNYMTYQTLIWTFGEDRVNNNPPQHVDDLNSYGSEIMKTGVAGLNATVTGTRSENQYSNWKDENGEWCSIYNPVITVTAQMPEDASVDYEPFMVRVWRQCGKIRNSFIEPTWGVRTNDVWSPRPADLLIVDEFVNGTQFTFGDAEANTLAFGATNDATIEFLVRFYYKVPDAAKADGEFKYYVVEKRIPWNNIETSVAEISIAGEGVNTYYNAQGLKSDKPFDGVNIVVTRYSDGSTKTTKIVR